MSLGERDQPGCDREKAWHFMSGGPQKADLCLLKGGPGLVELISNNVMAAVALRKFVKERTTRALL